MTSEMQARARSMQSAIRQTLLQEWDPIGVKDIAEAQDEYDGYVPTIHKLLITRRPVHEVFDYLWWLETEHMGLTGDRQATQKIAEKLVEQEK